MNGYERAKPPLLKSITAKNLLSFGPEGMTLDLEPLNVLIGPNGSGKSNLLEAIGLFQAAPRNLAAPVRRGGGVGEWIWKGNPDSSAIAEVVVSNPKGKQNLRHTIEFAKSSHWFELVNERIADERPHPEKETDRSYYDFQGGHPVMTARDGSERRLKSEDFAPDESILSQRKDPDQFPELAYLSRSYERIRMYRGWEFGQNTALRAAQRADVRRHPLAEDFHNLEMFLNKLRQVPKAKANFIKKLGDLYDGLMDFELNFDGGTVQIYFTEGDFAIPATRLSDGSLRYLCLLAILLDPDPPPLICLEEPELGLHPDMMHKLADLLMDASSRCQLVVTTHSDILVDALTEDYRSVVVCEKHDGRTNMKRLSEPEFSHWLEKYRLGHLWTSGHLGGVRW